MQQMESPSHDDAVEMTRVTGVFRKRSTVVRAVERLSRKSVPSDSIRVFVHGPEGERREIPVEDESGTLRGAIWGAICGGLLGLAIALAAAVGLLGPTTVDAFGFRGLAGVFRAALGGAAAAVPLGALLGLGFWDGRKRISQEDFQKGTATVVVESDELAELARLTLHEAGALNVTVD